MKSILITGANGGIGQACARAFLAEHPDCYVFLGCRHGRSGAEAIVASFPERARIVTLDVTAADSWKQAVAGVMAVTGRVDVLVANLARIGKEEEAPEATDDGPAVSS